MIARLGKNSHLVGQPQVTVIGPIIFWSTWLKSGTDSESSGSSDSFWQNFWLASGRECRAGRNHSAPRVLLIKLSVGTSFHHTIRVNLVMPRLIGTCHVVGQLFAFVIMPAQTTAHPGRRFLRVLRGVRRNRRRANAGRDRQHHSKRTNPRTFHAFISCSAKHKS